jgi:uncharacterized RDD family membrane protein YckC
LKCPKCGYLGFERVERCRNCGYDFPSASIRELPELSLRGADDRVTQSDDELPLFGGARDPRTAGPTPPPRPPLSVRRATPEVRRPRLEERRAPLLDLSATEDSVAAMPHASRRDTAPLVRPLSVDAAGHGVRLAAGIVDLLLLMAIDALVVSLTLQICGLTMEELGVLPVVPLFAFLILQNGGYVAAFTAGGQTIGKMAFGLRVVSAATGERVDAGHAATRALVWALMALPAGLGFASVLLDREGRGWHDHAAGTRVVRA